MDLSKLNVVEKANAGTILELVNPFDGVLLTDEGEKVGDPKNIKPFYLRLLGSDSDIYRNAIKRRFERSRDGKVVVCTQPEMVRLYMKLPWLREQAEDHIGDRSALMTS